MAVATGACVGAIIAGGRATRMGGRPKGLDEVGGRRILDRVAGALAQVTDGLLLVANAPDAASWLPGVETVGDVVPDAGALGGLLTALAHAGAPVLAVAWDMPFVPASLLGELRRVAEAERADAAVPERDAAGRVEPLCAYYGLACRPAAARRVGRGELRVVGLLDEVRARRLPLARVLDWGDPERLFLNVNTPAELELARRLARGATTP
jgi:molybdopterin-guanine dinucleotide biosynthesis protein A